MSPPLPIPHDVREWLRQLFASCNQRVSSILSSVPTTYETSLDMSFIQHFVGVAAPHRFPSGWTLDLSTHFLGGGRHFVDWPDPRRWEIADIGLLVLFRHNGKLIRSKVALLQSKRLYPDELDWDEDNAVDYLRGFGRLYQPDDEWSAVTQPRQFTFREESRYRALVTGLGQYDAIARYEKARKIPVYYMLYNPLQLPSTAVMPIAPRHGAVDPPADIGCRIVPATDLRDVLSNAPDGATPAYGDLANSLPVPFDQVENRAGWRLEHFVADLLLDCEVGYIAAGPNDGGLDYIFNRRSGPISAALSLTIDAPEGATID